MYNNYSKHVYRCSMDGLSETATEAPSTVCDILKACVNDPMGVLILEENGYNGWSGGNYLDSHVMTLSKISTPTAGNIYTYRNCDYISNEFSVRIMYQIVHDSYGTYELIRWNKL